MSSFVAVTLTWVLALLSAILWPAGIAIAQEVAQDKPTAVAVAPLDKAAFQAELERLDAICAKLNLREEQTLMQRWPVSEHSDAHLLFLPVALDPLGASGKANATTTTSGTAGAHANWLKHFLTARTRHAQFWLDSARREADDDEWAAYRSLWRAAREDSTHPETKRILGPLLSSLSVKGKPRTVSTVHPKFGWPGGSYTRMETANFKITSRTDSASTVQIAERLETFYALWTQAFYPLWAAPNVTRQRLAGRNTNWHRRQQVDVVLCKDRDDYLKTLGIAEANIGVSVGYYSPEAQLSFFYPDASLDATLFHELTHQLLSESSQLRGTLTAGESSNFWLVEAVALYMESLVPAEHHWRLGGWSAQRMQSARYRAVHDGYWLEPKELDAIGLNDWKQREDLARIYTHAAGLAHFFMDRRLPPAASESSATAATAQAAEERLNKFDAERSRAAFFSALIAAYRGDQPSEGLWQIAGGPQAQQDYLHFLLVRDRHIDAQLQSNLPVAAIKELVLTRSQLSPASWQAMGSWTHLTWLDLSYANAQPSDLGWLKDMQQLERLSLEGIAVDAQLLANVASLPQLKELDLSHSQVTDEGLVALKSCASLETLWLSDTKVSAESCLWLEKLPRLSFVALEGTQVNAETAKALNDKLKRR